jgi:LuxR family maltose regulon positive regulatory protein
MPRAFLQPCAMVDSSGATSNQPGNSSPPLLETKLYVPVPKSRSSLVARPRLTERLQPAAERKLTVVVGPAGFGKTTLLGEWIAGRAEPQREIAWVSLDPTENEPSLFWSYVIRALQKIHPNVGSRAISLLRSPQPPPTESVLTELINDLTSIDSDVVLVLDDYHVIDAVSVHESLTFLLDHLPPRVHVAIASRSDPPAPVPLARLRARGELAEVRVADLRFTNDEAAAFLNQVMALGLSTTDTAKLERRTEGWIAGLKLAALSMKGREDVRGFVDAFAGDNRYVADYLVDEVLQAEPEHIRRFLLGTAILDRLTGPLCDAVMGEPGSQALLESLERRNLFVVALDDRREWYRYHHLFADVLQAQSAREDPDRARGYHRRASAWYDEHGSSGDAVRHAIAAEDLDRAAGLLEMTWPERDRSYQSGLWLSRVKALPDAVVRVRPVLSLGYAWALLNSGELEAAEPRLRDVERWMDAADTTARPDASQMVVTDAARFQSLPTELASARIYLSQALGGVPGTVEHAKRALDLIPEGDHAARSTGIALLALAYWARGDLEAAHRTFTDALASMRLCGHGLDAIRGIFVLGDLRVGQGRLREAASIYERGLQVAAEEVHPTPPETDELYLGLSEVHREWGELEAAARFLATVTQLADRTAHRGNRQRWCTAMARILEARGDLPGALALLDEAESHDVRTPIPRVRPIAAIKVRFWIAQRRFAESADWVDAQNLSTSDDLAYLREFEHVTLARLLLARHQPGADERDLHDVVQLLDRLATAAQEGGRMGSLIEILMLQSLAQQALGNVRRGLDPLTRALELAEPEGYLRVFVDEGSRVRDLLRHATARGISGEYTRRVLAGFDEPKPPASEVGRIAGGSVQLLTTRELEILRLIAAGMRNQEIADLLSISAATVKRHIANAYGKLGATHRTEALVRAKELKLL